ncbi:SMI1/KNR4 family protein [Rhodococcus hoagii]|nr:SMI1/KNR4 family protein [Prescottella equi]
MTLTEAWSAYMSVLRELAPATAASIRPPRSPLDREDAERATTTWTDEVREFYALHDGQDTDGQDTAGTALPNLMLLSLDEVVTAHRPCRESLHDTDDLDADWPAIARGQQAGEIAHMFLDAYVPFAEDGAGDYRIVDTRSGEHRGCVRAFGWEGADEVGPQFPSLAEYVDSVRRSLETGEEHSYLVPRVEDGVLFWEVDDSGRI